ncbi:Mitotic spindle assembly checkpoint protein MAD1 [Oopsacas minuta]|uniref:Translocation protein SEC62 n=1 Tax=Oopsacas minuta TaxID=111878 RepID=A0AAV7JX50_9METZ|nr:Mitotic spindle assembly checkpoint protein MAD1 [Oopsacas minuta]
MSSQAEESVFVNYKDVTKYLRFNLPCKTGKLQRERMSYFTGADAIDTLMESKWAKKPHSKGLFFDSRYSALDFCTLLLKERLIVRCEMIKLDADGKPEAKQKDTIKNKKKDLSASPKSEETTKRKKVFRKYKFEVHGKQNFSDLDDSIYAWRYNPTSSTQFLMGFALVIGFIAFNLAPIWPSWMRSGMGMTAWLLCAVIGFLLLLIVVRIILYYTLYAVSCGKWNFWLLPNLHQDCGILESFIPFYSFESKELEQKYLGQVELLEKANTRLNEELAPVLAKYEDCENKCKKLERDIQQREDDAHIFACVNDKLPNLIKAEKKYLQLQADNEILMGRCRDFEMIRERAIDFEGKYNRSESRLRELSSVITENSQLKQALQKWEKFDSAAITHMGFGSPDTLIRKYCDMQQQLVLLTEKSGDLQTTLTISESRLASVSRELCEVKSELAIEKANCNIKNEQCQKLERKLVYIKMDRDSYPKLIKSYDKASFSHSSEDELLKVRVERSEQNLARAEERIKELEGELENIHNASNSNIMELTIANSQLSSLMIELESKTTSIARLQSKMEWLEQQNKIYQQENNNLELQLTSKTQELKNISSLETKNIEEEAPRQIWVHFKRNNLSNAREEKMKELLKLRTENEELRLAIENGEYSLEDMVHKKEVNQLKDRLKYADVMENRLKESFSKRITEFREVCSMLTGYRIDAQPGGKYKIRSVYAESADDYLEFVISQGNLSLLPTSYSDKIQSKVTLYLNQHSSLPCLLSDITMELYKKCTLFLDP